MKASLSTGDEAVADTVRARRIRRDILEDCERRLNGGTLSPDDAFWVLATKVEAYVGLQLPDAERLLQDAVAKAPQPWMAKSLMEQVEKLKKLPL